MRFRFRLGGERCSLRWWIRTESCANDFSFFLQYSSFSINCLSFLLEFVILKIKFFNICYLKKSHSKNSYLLFSNNNQYSHKHSLHAEASLKSPIIKPSIKRPVSTSCPSLETTFQTTRSIEVVVRMGASKSSLAVKSVDWNKKEKEKKEEEERKKRAWSPESRTSRVVHADLQSLITYAVQHFMRQVPVVISYVPSPLLCWREYTPPLRVHTTRSLAVRVFLPRNEPLLDGCSLPPVRRPKINGAGWSGAGWKEGGRKGAGWREQVRIFRDTLRYTRRIFNEERVLLVHPLKY